MNKTMETIIEHLIVQAKRKDCEAWIEGYLLVMPYDIANDVCYLTNQTNLAQNLLSGRKEITSIGYEVDPKTIRRWSGQYDNTGKKIWEGDIVKVLGTKRVGWYESIVIWERHQFKIKENKAILTGFPPRKMIEVIGNIFDNPKYLNYLDEKYLRKVFDLKL